MDNQINYWRLFIQDIFNDFPDANIYLNGGSSLVLYILKTYDINFNLINDFDLVWINPEYNDDYLFNNKNISLNGRSQKNKSSLNVLRSNNVNHTLFEMRILQCDININELELPLTSVKMFITKENYNIFFDMAINLDTSLLNNFEFYTHSCNKNGLFSVDNINYGNLSRHIINIIDMFDDLDDKQFLICMISNPNNLSRLIWKNINKSNKIKSFCDSELVLNDDHVICIYDKFIMLLKEKVNSIFSSYQKNICDLLEKINKCDIECAIYDCHYDLQGIGGNPNDVLLFLNNQSTDNESIITSPIIKKYLSNKNYDIKNRINTIAIKCAKYNVSYEKSINVVNPSMLRNNVSKEQYLYREQLTEIYVKLFNELYELLNLNILRWKNNIKLYENTEAINCILSIFSFYKLIQVKLQNGDYIISNNKLSLNPVWLLIIELKKLK